MQDTDKPDGDVIIITVNRTNYWLANGIAHLDAILMGGAPYPTPIRCVAFTSMAHLRSFIPEGVDGLWGIHPEIVARLRREGELLDEAAP